MLTTSPLSNDSQIQLQNRTVATKLGIFLQPSKSTFSPIQLYNPALATKYLRFFTSLSLYKNIYFHVIHNIMILGYMFRPHCGRLQANLYRLSALNVHTVWDPIMCTIKTYVR